MQSMVPLLEPPLARCLECKCILSLRITSCVEATQPVMHAVLCRKSSCAGFLNAIFKGILQVTNQLALMLQDRDLMNLLNILTAEGQSTLMNSSIM